MSRLDELERELFRLASAEAPSPTLRQRVHERLAASAGSVARGDASSERPHEQSRRAARPRRRIRLVVASLGGAVALAAGVLLVFSPPRDLRSATTLEAEPLPAPAPAPASAPAPAKPRLDEPPVVQPRPRPVASAESGQPVRPAMRTPRSLAEQLELLGQARSALRAGNGARALTLLDEYAERKNSVDMNAEALLLRIEALQAVGRRGQAGVLAEQFIARYPDNPLADRARSLVRGRVADTAMGMGMGMGREDQHEQKSNETNDNLE